MSVVIRGMKMPKSCDECPCYYETEGAWRNECEVLGKEYIADDYRPEWCPLVELPPHGDLIDYNFCLKNYELLHDDDGNPVYAVRMRDINAAPAVIEAEEVNG